MDNAAVSAGEARPPTNQDRFPVVGIGASAGGLEALEEFFSHVPPNSGMAYIVIQHLSPDFKSVMDQLLARRTKLPIHMIENGMLVERDQLYLLPPRKEVILSGGRLLLADRGAHELLSFPIDIFFRSLAQDAGRHGVAVVLSGTGTDGSRGILDVHAAGGVVVAQNDETAKFDGMPRSASATGVVDFVLSPREIPAALLRYAANPVAQHRSTTESFGRMEGSLLAILSRLKDQYGLDFTNYKTTTISRRIERRLTLSGTQDLDEYAERVERDDEELDRLYRDLLIGVTGFFRDKEVFDRLEMNVLPDLLGRLAPGDEFRAWVAACATGEEAYSLAILLSEQLELALSRPVRIFASDVHQRSLAIASRGIYQAEALAGVTAERLRKFFIERSDGFHVVPEIRKMVVFTPHNVVRDAPFTKLDLITCRNMLIYLTPAAQKKTLSLFHFGLKRNGVLCLGTSETTGDLADEFEPIEERYRVYRKHRDTRLRADLRLPAAMPSPVVDLPQLSRAVPGSSLMRTYDKLLDRFMPPSVLISGSRELLHAFPGVAKYLRRPEGRPSLDVLEMIPAELRAPLSAGLRHVREHGQPISYTDVPCSTSEGLRQVKLTLWPVPDNPSLDQILVQFEDQPDAEAGLSTPEIAAQSLSSDEYESLQRELQYTKDNLQSTIEELQTTNEELQAANEQLTSSNEELQSTNEELHSVNEELYTVNGEHQRKIDELTELTNDMDNLLNSTNVHTVFLDRQLCIRRFTPGVAEVFNLIPQDVGRRFDSFSHRIIYDELTSEVQRVLHSGDPCEREVIDQRGVWYLLRIRPYIARGCVDGVVITLVDITSLKQAQAKIEEMSEIVEHSEDAIYRVDMDGTIRTWNLGASRLYGYDARSVIGQHISILSPDDRPSEPSTFLDRIRGGISVDRVETQRKRRNGTLVHVSLTVSPIRDAHGQIIAASAVSRDITRQKQAEAEILAAVRHRDQFLATLSHELRNPLAAILNATALLKEPILEPALAEEARMVVESQLQHVARLLDDLLDVARFANGKLSLRKEVVDMSALMSDVVAAVRFQVEDQRQQLHVDRPTVPLYVEGDAGRLQQAQVNLLINASKYSREGQSIWYGIRREGTELVVEVRDEGNGVAASLLPTIFEPFVQADQTIERARGGMGLGLPLVRMIAQAHGGSADGQSSGPGLGSVFTIRLPLTERVPSQSPVVAGFSGAGRKILLIEDNDGIRRMLSRSLELRGFNVACAVNGRDGLECFTNFRPDVAIVDIGLPDMNGYDLARQVRSRTEFDQTLLVAVTGYGREEDRQKATFAGFDMHLVKPVDPGELLKSISELRAAKT